MKTQPDKGKHAAPRWLVYPELSAWTIGWRMGYGEVYALNEGMRSDEFRKLFPQPKNWLFNPRRCGFDRLPFIGFLWDGDELPKYPNTTEDAVEVNGFITPESEGEFQIDSYMFSSIGHAVLFSKFSFFGKCQRKTPFEELQKMELSDDELEKWKPFEYPVLLNAAYYKVMQDEELKGQLLETGDAPLIYTSDDSENQFGRALMELRDEIRRLCENDDRIDWEYTRYLMEKDPYEDPKPKDTNDRQSAEYMVVSSTIAQSKYYVRDADLDEKFASKYEIGQIILEKAFVDASNRIGGMATTHRYLILSNAMADLSPFEDGRGWGIHVAKNSSRFKVLDIFEHDEKTQITLLQLPEGFEGVFEETRDVEEEAVENARELFIDCLKKDVIPELATPEWLERVKFPLGMDDDGEFFKD